MGPAAEHGLVLQAVEVIVHLVAVTLDGSAVVLQQVHRRPRAAGAQVVDSIPKCVRIGRKIISAVPPNWRTGIRHRERLEATGRAPAAEIDVPPKSWT